MQIINEELDIDPPLVGTPHVNILVPNAQELSNILEQHRQIDDCITVKANNCGVLEFHTVSLEAKITTGYTNLCNPKEGYIAVLISRK